jgi:DNA-binding cell septation regulator SpoVG
MEIEIKHFNDQFNVHLSSKAGAEPFLEIKGCRIANGKNGPFVSWPSTKNQQTGKYWQHVYSSEKFSAAVLEKAQASMPKQGGRQAPAGGDDSDIPFADPLKSRAFLAL